MDEAEIKRERAEAMVLLNKMIDGASGDMRRALTLFRDESEQCEFWLLEAIALANGIGKALKFVPPGIGHDQLVQVLRESRERAEAHRATGP